MDYRVELEAFSGPLDLLLFLVRREEVEISALSIGRLTEQYLKYMEQIERVDVDAASDYLVVASTLLELKARSLLPAADAGPDLEGIDDPRKRLIDDLLEYRRLHDEVRALESREGQASLHFARTSERSMKDRPLGHVDLWDLVTAFKVLSDQIGARVGAQAVVEQDPEPVESYIARLRARMAATPEGVRFADLFDDLPGRAALVTTFLALLELIRLCEVRAAQSSTFGEILIVPLTDAERVARRPHDAVAAEVHPPAA